MNRAVLVLVLIGCTPQPETLVSGVVYESRLATAPPLEGADVAFVDFDGEPLGEATTDADGRFELPVPSSTNVFVEVSADGWHPTVFPGVIGLEETLEVDVRLYPYDPREVDALRETFAGCPGADEPGPVVLGEIRLDNIYDEISGEQVIVTTGTATVTDADGDTWEACYYDFEGEAYDPGALRTGSTGFFVIFGAPTGRLDLDLSYEYIQGAFVQQFYPMYLPSDDTVSPWFPAAVPFIY